MGGTAPHQQRSHPSSRTMVVCAACRRLRKTSAGSVQACVVVVIVVGMGWGQGRGRGQCAMRWEWNGGMMPDDDDESFHASMAAAASSSSSATAATTTTTTPPAARCGLCAPGVWSARPPNRRGWHAPKWAKGRARHRPPQTSSSDRRSTPPMLCGGGSKEAPACRAPASPSRPRKRPQV